MAQKSDVTIPSQQSWMLAKDVRIRNSVQIRIDDHGSIERDPDPGTISPNFLFVPISDFFEEPPFCAHDTINGSVVLNRLDDALIAACLIIQNLNLRASQMRILPQR